MSNEPIENIESSDQPPVPTSEYAGLCALIGERHYLASKLAAEIAILQSKLDELALKKIPSVS